MINNNSSSNIGKASIILDDNGYEVCIEKQERDPQGQTMINNSININHEITSILHVTVLDGNGLVRPDDSMHIDPYLQLRYGENVSISSAQSNTGVHCDFNWSVAFPVHNSRTVCRETSELTLMTSDPLDTAGDLLIEVKDDTRGGKIGKGNIRYQDISKGQGKMIKLVELSDTGSALHELGKRLTLEKFGKKSGSLNIEYRLEEFSPSKDAFPIPTLRLLNNHNIRGGIIRSILDGGRYESFPTWQIRLWEVMRIFNGEYSHWNESYPAAQKIYGPGLQSIAIREAIRTEHSILYSKDKAIFGSSQNHLIHGMESLIRFLPTSDKNTTPGKSVRFTYVILKNSNMHFSITSKKTAQDFLSKHALHNNAGTKVVYAGEFFIDNKSERYQTTGKPALIIDNNSGTFAPAKEKLQLLHTLFEFNFGKQYPILTLDRSDPVLSDYFDINNVE